MGYPQQPYGHHDPRTGPVRPARRTIPTGVLVGVALAAVLVVAGIAVTIVATSGSARRDDVNATAQDLARALSTNKGAEISKVSCRRPTPRQITGYDTALAMEPVDVTVKQQPRIDQSGQTAIVVMRVVARNGALDPQDLPYKLLKNSHGWCVQFEWSQFDKFAP